VTDIVSSIAAAIEEQSTVTKDIARNIAEASAGVGDANARVSETSKAAMDIARGIVQIDEGSRHIADGSESVRNRATAISEVSEQLQAMISRFHVSGDSHAATLSKAIAAHSAWTSRLRAAIQSRHLDIPVSTIRADNECQFGKWLYGTEFSGKEKQSEHYRKAKQLHARFHEEASRVAQLALSGERNAAELALNESSEYERSARALADALTRWQASA
jgi:methyl-accepting chemotaxis protein